MFNTLSCVTYRRWAIFYASAATLLAGWLLLEKMPDGRVELAGSVEGTFWRSREAATQYNNEMMEAIQDGVEDYPSLAAEDYRSRAEKALSLATAFANQSKEEGATKRFCLLRDSFLILADSNSFYQATTDGFRDVNPENEYLKKHKSLKTSLLLAGSQTLASSILNYCAIWTNQKGCGFDKWIPGFLLHTASPMAGEPFHAEVFFTGFSTSDFPRYNTICWLNDQPLPLLDGIATIRTTFPTPGPHTLRLRFRRERCRDGSVTEVSRDFTVNVLERCDTND